MGDFAEIYRQHSQNVFKYLLFLTGDYLLSEELLQETFYQAFKSIHRFKGNSKLSTWLYQIAKHVYLKHQRRKKSLPLNDNQTLTVENLTPEIIFEVREDYSTLYQAVNQLNDPYNEVVILRGLNELSFREIGNIFDKNENWARVTFYRAKLQLRKILKEADHFENGL